jgi:hypothetical protein
MQLLLVYAVTVSLCSYCWFMQSLLVYIFGYVVIVALTGQIHLTHIPNKMGNLPQVTFSIPLPSATEPPRAN